MLKYNTETFVSKALEVHGGRYDYSEIVFGEDNVNIICLEHGVFSSNWREHIRERRGGSGCPKCAQKAFGILAKEKSLIRFFTSAPQKHHHKYDYSKFEYSDATAESTIICPLHGDFLQTPSVHIGIGNAGCPKCGRISRNKKVTEKALVRFFTESPQVHNHKYDYSKFDYINSATKGIIVCPHHGEFFQSPGCHLRGSGCKKCNCAKGWVRERYEGVPSTLYYAKINNLYKIGLTTYDSKRFSTDIHRGVDVKILSEIHYLYGVMAYDEEKRLLEKHKEYRYYGDKILISGNTELFTKDILNLDN